jgi:phosphinothricin acetyltransferase
MIRQVKISDAESICSIYNEYVERTTVTFEEEPVSADEMGSRIKHITQHFPWLVYEDQGNVLGYTYASRWKERSAYRYSVETAIYVDSNYVGMDIGTKLTRALLEELRALSIHSVNAGITLPNPASIALYEKFGFEKIAHFKEVGFKFNKWIDVGYWELVI